MNGRERMLGACRCQNVDRPPVWLMRQAGRYLPEYQKLKADRDFWTMVRTPELASEITLQPIRRFGMDAAIVFCDILIVPDAMGMKVKYTPGPQFDRVIGSMRDVEGLGSVDPAVQFGYLSETLGLVKKSLEGQALVGFAGAPLTLAAYMIEGKVSADLVGFKTLAYKKPEVVDALMQRLSDAVAELLLMQIEAGADVVQLFDTWAGRLSPLDYARWALPAVQEVVEKVRPTGAPVILYTKGAAGKLMALARSGADVLSLDAGVRLQTARHRLGEKQALQGNLDPVRLLGPTDGVVEGVKENLEATGGIGHIVNLGHGVLPPTPVASVEAFVDTVRVFRR